MKKLFTIILLAAVLFAACTHENNPVVEQIVTIQASIAHDSRVALGEDDEKKVNWTEDDVINMTIAGTEYPFTWQEETTFAYKGNNLPTLTQGMRITATYVSDFSSTQTGLKSDVGNYMVLSASTNVQAGDNYSDLNLTFSHGTSVLKLILSNEAFKEANVTDITLKAGTEVIAKATNTFTGDATNGSVTAYMAIQPAELGNITIHATCNGNTYTNTLGNNNIVAGKLYGVNKTLPYAYVDLGLPSGIKWASFNVGATSPEGYGDYFAWGETVSKSYYDYDNYEYNNNDNMYDLTKYCNYALNGNNGYTDNLTTLEPKDDAATANWGSCWRMPTSAEMQELLDNCTVAWTTQNGVNGYLATSQITGYTDKSIFLPAAGSKDFDGFLQGNGGEGRYWSSSLYQTNCIMAIILEFDYENITAWQAWRNVGFPVRPVYAGN